MRCIRVMFAVITCLSAFGCTHADDREMVKRQDEIVARALEEISLLRAFKKRFPDSQHFISYITGKDGRTTWNSKTALFGRYVLQMRVPANIDRDTLKVRLDAEPTFEIKEVTAINVLPDGREQVSYGKSIIFDAADWKRLDATDEDFAALGIKLKKDQPIEGFSDYSKY